MLIKGLDMPGWAEIDERRGRLYIMSWSAMRHGRRANGWVRVVERSVPSQELGFLVREALAQSGTDVPMVNFQDPAQSPMTPLLDAAGVKSYQGYARSMRACLIDFDDVQQRFLIRPTRNESRDGLVDLPDAQIWLPATANDAEVGEAVLQGIKRSIGRSTGVRRGSGVDAAKV
ncbi:hypothetical protein [Virgisporangium aurantiacum]|uniref:DUF1436 family protein n=1 Tax=Virgisporangium aurantiacum TaxID=175570 RepID=A0A8J3ZDN1_9ACTN|nr:hypothetical protein [Virgisporangium aurantiacum]GIJ62269.1 hypothetical protein Vau01_097850 [Virgisporangium aurantiacum]